MAASRKVITFRPPIRSVIMPDGSRHSDPFRTAAAMIQDSWTSLRSYSSLMGLPRIPNISHTANSRVKPIVDRLRTRVRPGASSWVPGVMADSFS